MSTTTATPSASFFAKAKKAFAGGIAGAGAAAGTAVTAAFSDGGFDQADAWTVAGAVVAGFVIGFGAVYVAPKNAA